MKLGQKIAEWRETRSIALANEICEELSESMPTETEPTEVAVVYLSKQKPHKLDKGEKDGE